MWQELIIQRRDTGEIRCALMTLYNGDEYVAAHKFGLYEQKEGLREVDAMTASAIIEALLWKEMAYKSEVMPKELAHSIASQFILAFPTDSTRFFTNALWHNYYVGESFGWEPFTEATFDGGVIAIAKPIAGCIWIEDED